MHDVLTTVFVSEAADLLAQLEDGLLELERNPADRSVLDRIFRAGHTLKGGAGLVNLTDIVGLAHLFENVLDRLRKQELAASPQLISLLLQGCDLLERMVARAIAGSKPGEITGLSELLDRLSEYASAPPAPACSPLQTAPTEGPPKTYVIDLRVRPDILENGQDPFMLLLELSELGQLLDVRAKLSELPPFEALDPHRMHLAWKIVLSTRRDRASLDDVFVFVREDVEFRVREVMDCRHFGSVAAVSPPMTQQA